MEDQIIVSLEKKIKTITLNNPTRKNAVTKMMIERVGEAVSESEHDGTHVVILTGAEGNFCSGADLMRSEEVKADVTTYLKESVNPTILALQNTHVPIIAKISGTCVGLGFNLALACDMLIASEDARFSQIFTNIGLSSDGGGGFFLPNRIGYYKAFELMALATVFSAEEALYLRLLNRVCTQQILDKTVLEIAERLAAGPLVAIKHTKANLRQGISGTLEDTLTLEAENQGKNFQTQDFVEGVAAFLQKRKPQFTGK
ncbi:MAG: enoyl-CoA hydratase-related protein [Bacteroidota bacterium]